MTHRHRLLTAFGSLLGAGALSACGSLRDDFEDSVCDAEGVALVRSLKPNDGADYVALRRSAGTGGEGTHSIVQEEGSACVTDAAECFATLAAPVEGGLSPDYSGAALNVAVTRADQAEVLLTLAEVRAFLGTIDTPSEAALLVTLFGYRLDCEGPNLNRESGGFLIYAESGHTCGSDVEGHAIFVAQNGSIEVRDTEVVEHGNENCIIGRIPLGLMTTPRPVKNGVGRFYREVAHLEAASVAAFEQLVRDLRHHGAPERLVAEAEAAVREETRHAILTGALARRYGQERPIPIVKRQPVRDLEGLAIENAVEGLVRETFGALVAHHQALHAADPAIRRVARMIATDETRHAALSWEIHDWVLPRLSQSARVRVEGALASALLRLKPHLCAEPVPVVKDLAGMPSARRATELFDGLQRSLWQT